MYHNKCLKHVNNKYADVDKSVSLHLEGSLLSAKLGNEMVFILIEWCKQYIDHTMLQFPKKDSTSPLSDSHYITPIHATRTTIWCLQIVLHVCLLPQCMHTTQVFLLLLPCESISTLLHSHCSKVLVKALFEYHHCAGYC